MKESLRRIFVREIRWCSIFQYVIIDCITFKSEIFFLSLSLSFQFLRDIECLQIQRELYYVFMYGLFATRDATFDSSFNFFLFFFFVTKVWGNLSLDPVSSCRMIYSERRRRSYAVVGHAKPCQQQCQFRGRRLCLAVAHQFLVTIQSEYHFADVSQPLDCNCNCNCTRCSCSVYTDRYTRPFVSNDT